MCRPLSSILLPVILALLLAASLPSQDAAPTPDLPDPSTISPFDRLAPLVAVEPFDEAAFLRDGVKLWRVSEGDVGELVARLDTVATSPSLEPGAATAEMAALRLGRLRALAGAILAQDGNDSAAIEQFGRALARAPQLAEARLLLGNALVRGERLPEAAGQYWELVTRHPQHVEARIRLGTLLERLGELDDAVVHLQEAARLAPAPREQLAARFFLAGLHRKRGERLEAAREYSIVIAAEPRHVPALEALASMHGEVGSYEEAAELYDRLIELEPKSAKPRIAQATALILAGEHAAARARLEDGLAELPENLDLKDVLARHLAACPDREVRDGERAVEIALDLYEQVPTPESLETLAMAYAEARRFESAVRAQKHLLGELAVDAAAADKERWQRNLQLYEMGIACCADD